MTANLAKLLRKYGIEFLRAPLARLEGRRGASLADDAQYLAEMADEAWRVAPLQVRLFKPDSLGWNDFLLRSREWCFEDGQDSIRLRSDWQTRLAAEIEKIEPPSPAPTSSKVSSAKIDSTAKPADEQQPVIGIDLGTTYSVVAHVDGQGRPTSIINAAGDILTPSVVLFDHDGPVVGKQAVLAAAMDPDKVAECVKRDMGAKHFRRKIGGESLPPEVISSIILKNLRADAERKLGPISRAVITVPAYFDESRRRATMDAGRMAGLQVLDILNEPTAAAIAYGYQEGFLDRDSMVKGERPLKVLVYDLGGGTFDVTIVELGAQSFKALATDGDVRLGGKDWDEKLIEIAAEKFKAQHGQDPRANPETLQELSLSAENAKKTLTELSKATMVVNHLGQRMRVEVTRREFEDTTAPLLLRTRTTTEIVVMQAGLSWDEIDLFLLVGGSTRMPQVHRMLKDLTGRDPDRSVSVDEAVAHGAALYAELMAKKGVPDEPPAFTVKNVNSHSLGVSGMEPGTGRRINAIVVPKNSPLPHAAARRFKTAKPNQPNVRIVVLEGESEEPDACAQVGVCLIRDLPPNLPAGWPVEVRFAYRENGRLQVAGKLVGHDSSVTVDFVRDNSLSDDDLMLWAECLQMT